MPVINAHFLNVGDGDCTIVELPDGGLMMVDIKNGRNDMSHNSDYTNPIQYLANLTNNRTIHRYVQTHPDMDHMDGLADLTSSFSIVNVWDTGNKKPKDDDFGMYREKDWDAYRNIKQTSSRVIYPLRQTNTVVADSGPYIYDIYPLSPTQEILDHANSTTESWNESSFLTLVRYGGLKILFGGDATTEIWDEIGEWINTDDDASKLLNNITVFKTSHHGRKSGYCGESLLYWMNPKEIITDRSVDADKSANNFYDAYAKMESDRRVWDISQNNIFATHIFDTTEYNIKHN